MSGVQFYRDGCDRPKEHEWRGQAENDLGGECGERRLTDRLAYQSGDEGGGLVVNNLFMSKKGRSARGKMYFTRYGIFPATD